MDDTNGQDILTTLKEKLSIYLNKRINESLITTIISQYQRNNSLEQFTNFVKVFGLVNSDHVCDLYNQINDNYASIEKVLKERSSNSQKVKLLRVVEKPKKIKTALKLSFDELDDELEEIETPAIKTKPIPKLDDELELDEEMLDINVNKKTISKSTTKFKKIKKDDAIRIKQETIQAPKPSETTNNSTSKDPPKPQVNAVPESKHMQQPENTPIIDDYPKFEELSNTNLEVDREWYNIDEEGAVAKSDEIDDTDFHPRRPQQQRRNRPIQTKSTKGSGGLFDPTTGEYIDYDHSSADEFSRVPISSHVFIPPFLENSKEYLQLQISGSSIRGIGPTVNPIKDSTSELASMARQGSLVVQNKRSKKERMQQAKERTGVSGSNLEKIIPEEDDDVASPDSTKMTEEIEADPIELITQQRRSLPAFLVRDQLLQTIRDNQVTIIIGETGSGKTTQLTQYLYEDGFGSSICQGKERVMIGCTQPRRVAAMSVAKRVSEEMNCKLGEEVGFSIRFEDKTDNQKTIIKYMTEGVLLRETLVDPMLSHYSCIIMDEAHERSLNTDILLGLFKNLITKRRDLKLIVTSATMNAERFMMFFGAAPQFTIPGRTFPVEVFYNKSICSDYVDTAIKQVLTIHLKDSNTETYTNDGDILVFMTGQEDIEITCELLREKLDMLESPPPLDIFPIYSTMPADLQKKIFTKKNSKRRKVVVATNIAETSLTVDGIKYVIDCGLVKMKVYNPKLGMDMLQVVPISVANADQRSGRAGRTGPGVAYRLYTEQACDPARMHIQPIPEIQRTNLSNIMLLLKSLKVGDVNSFPFLDPPPKDLLNCSMYDLWAMNALDNLGELTSLGESMTKFPIEPTLSKLILLSTQAEFHCSDEIISIVAMLSVPNIYHRPKERAQEADMAREKFMISESDHLTLLNVYNQWNINLKKFGNNYSRINSWCNKNFIQLKSLFRAKDIRNQLLLIMQKNKLPILKSRNDEHIRKCLCASFYQQSAKISKMNVHGNPEFVNLRHSYMKMYLHPTSSLLDMNLSSNFVIYHELVLTTKEYMHYVTCVDPVWLLEYGYKFYGIPDSYSSRLDSEVSIVTKKEFEKQLKEDAKIYEMRIQKQTRAPAKDSGTVQKSGSLFKRRRAI
ncbi:uncharacterized protein J8A68_003201 [[Candida] subhashii]|uniref:RNA helicase n=1 Tax=[Candida] subhashii TaxID=561895 RepID=A0A8J5UMU6_9ASCO|nr:uncharacterized protein J8A68_003201 [[Candida] subhashii]KAG7663287.1 hypothetical protein J8A68_003201 [[Candida] subhashii]